MTDDTIRVTIDQLAEMAGISRQRIYKKCSKAALMKAPLELPGIGIFNVHRHNKGRKKYKITKLSQSSDKLGLISAIKQALPGENPEDNRRDYKQRQMRDRRQSGRDIGLHLHTGELDKKKKYQFNLESFLIDIFPETFYRPFSPEHKNFIQRLQDTLVAGGQEAIAMPRTSGKTSIVECSIVWALGYGHRRYVVIVCATGTDSENIKDSIYGIFSTPETRFAGLFPEIVHYFAALENITQRANSQLADGKLTGVRVDNMKKFLKTAAIEKNETHLELCSEGIVEFRGLDSHLRGLKKRLKSGENVRPDFILLDDLQDRKSANSKKIIDKMEKMINADIVGLGGGSKKISMVMTCTVIERNDLSDRFLNRWHSIRIKLVIKFPDEDKKLWREYVEMRRELKHEKVEHEVNTACNSFYRSHRRQMDAGGEVYWEHRYDEKQELSALQAAYNFIADNGFEAFCSEFQNDPQEAVPSLYEITPQLVASRTSGIDKMLVPADVSWLVVGADVNYIGINYVVAGFKADFTGYVIDWGKYPEGVDELVDIGTENEEIIAQKLAVGILGFAGMLKEKVYLRQNHLTGRTEPFIPSLALMDCNFRPTFCIPAVRAVQTPFRFLPDRGRSVQKYKPPAQKERLIGIPGDNLHYERAVRGEQIVHCADYWRMIAQKSFIQPPGVPGAMSLFGNNPRIHDRLATEICGERLVQMVQGQEREMYEWHEVVGRRNDLLDALVICFVGASLLGARLGGASLPLSVKPPQGRRRQPSVPLEYY